MDGFDYVFCALFLPLSKLFAIAMSRNGLSGKFGERGQLSIYAWVISGESLSI